MGATVMGKTKLPPWKWSWDRMEPPTDGQVRVGADEVVGKALHEVEEPCKAVPADVHGPVLFAKHDAVLVVIQVGGVLQIPALPAKLQGHDAVVLPGREARPARIARVFRAEHAGG